MTDLFVLRFVNADGLYLPGAPFFVAALLVVAIVPLILRLGSGGPGNG